MSAIKSSGFSSAAKCPAHAPNSPILLTSCTLRVTTLHVIFASQPQQFCKSKGQLHVSAHSPPAGMTVQRLRLYCLAHQDFGYVQISLGNTAMAVGACMHHQSQAEGYAEVAPHKAAR